MADMQTILTDPDFQGLPLPEKNRVLMQVDPDYASLPPPERMKALNVIHYNPTLGPMPKEKPPWTEAQGVGGPMMEFLQRAAKSGVEHIGEQLKAAPGQAAETFLAPPGTPHAAALETYRAGKQLVEQGAAPTAESLLEQAVPLPVAKAAQQAGRGEWPEAVGTMATGAAELAALGKVGGKLAGMKAAGPDLPKMASNLSAALEMGGRSAKGVSTYEEVAQPILDDFRAEAARQGVTEKAFEGRGGYTAAKKVTEGVRTLYNRAYDSLMDPLRDKPATEAAKSAAADVTQKLSSDTALVDELTRTGNLERLTNLRDRIASTKTLGELDDMRVALNRLSSKYASRPGAQQYQSPIFQEALDSGADAIRSSLYPEIARAYPDLAEADVRELQSRHGAAIEADSLMENTVKSISKAASEEAAKGGWWSRLRGSAYRLTMQPKHAAGGLIERLFPPSDVELFNTRMKRVIEGAMAEGGRVMAVPPTPEPKGTITSEVVRPGQPALPPAPPGTPPPPEPPPPGIPMPPSSFGPGGPPPEEPSPISVLQARSKVVRDPKTGRMMRQYLGGEEIKKPPTPTETPTPAVAPKKVTGPEASDLGYVYHATSAERAAEIAKSGLQLHKPSEYTDQVTWPDRSTGKRAYFTPTAEHTWQFAPEEGQPVLLRVKADSHPLSKESTGDIFTTKAVPASKIEVLGEDNKWRPLSEEVTKPKPPTKTVLRRLHEEEEGALKPEDMVAAIEEFGPAMRMRDWLSEYNANREVGWMKPDGKVIGYAAYNHNEPAARALGVETKMLDEGGRDDIHGVQEKTGLIRMGMTEGGEFYADIRGNPTDAQWRAIGEAAKGRKIAYDLAGGTGGVINSAGEFRRAVEKVYGKPSAIALEPAPAGGSVPLSSLRKAKSRLREFLEEEEGALKPEEIEKAIYNISKKFGKPIDWSGLDAPWGFIRQDGKVIGHTRGEGELGTHVGMARAVSPKTDMDGFLKSTGLIRLGSEPGEKGAWVTILSPPTDAQWRAIAGVAKKYGSGKLDIDIGSYDSNKAIFGDSGVPVGEIRRRVDAIWPESVAAVSVSADAAARGWRAAGSKWGKIARPERVESDAQPVEMGLGRTGAGIGAMAQGFIVSDGSLVGRDAGAFGHDKVALEFARAAGVAQHAGEFTKERLQDATGAIRVVGKFGDVLSVEMGSAGLRPTPEQMRSLATMAGKDPVFLEVRGRPGKKPVFTSPTSGSSMGEIRRAVEKIYGQQPATSEAGAVPPSSLRKIKPQTAASIVKADPEGWIADDGRPRIVDGIHPDYLNYPTVSVRSDGAAFSGEEHASIEGAGLVTATDVNNGNAIRVVRSETEMGIEVSDAANITPEQIRTIAPIAKGKTAIYLDEVFKGEMQQGVDSKFGSFGGLQRYIDKAKGVTEGKGVALSSLRKAKPQVAAAPTMTPDKWAASEPVPSEGGSVHRLGFIRSDGRVIKARINHDEIVGRAFNIDTDDLSMEELGKLYSRFMGQGNIRIRHIPGDNTLLIQTLSPPTEAQRTSIARIYKATGNPHIGYDIGYDLLASGVEMPQEGLDEGAMGAKSIGEFLRAVDRVYGKFPVQPFDARDKESK